MNGRGRGQENGSEAVVVDKDLGDESEGGIWLDRGIFRRRRGDGDSGNLRIIHR